MNRLLIAATLLVGATTLHAADNSNVQHSLYQFQMRMAQQGNADAAFYVAQMSEEGLGTAQNLSEAIAWYKKAAEKGHPEADQRLQRLEQKHL